MSSCGRAVEKERERDYTEDAHATTNEMEAVME